MLERKHAGSDWQHLALRNQRLERLEHLAKRLWRKHKLLCPASVGVAWVQGRISWAEHGTGSEDGRCSNGSCGTHGTGGRAGSRVETEDEIGACQERTCYLLRKAVFTLSETTTDRSRCSTTTMVSGERVGRLLTPRQRSWSSAMRSFWWRWRGRAITGADTGPGIRLRMAWPKKALTGAGTWLQAAFEGHFGVEASKPEANCTVKSFDHAVRSRITWDCSDVRDGATMKEIREQLRHKLRAIVTDQLNWKSITGYRLSQCQNDMTRSSSCEW